MSQLIGQNKIVFSAAQMNEALQYYFETVMFRDSPGKVTNVWFDANDYCTFTITVVGDKDEN